jgi:hypothetical protein
MFKKIAFAAIAAFALTANAQQPKTCTTPDGTTLTATPAAAASAPAQAAPAVATAPANAASAASGCAPAKPVARKPTAPANAAGNADAMRRLSEENTELRAQVLNLQRGITGTVTPQFGIQPAPASSAAPTLATSIAAPISGAAPKERDFNVTVHTKKVRCLFRENGEVTVRTYRDTVQLCHDWANATSLSLGLVDTVINFDKVSGDVVASATAPAAATSAVTPVAYTAPATGGQPVEGEVVLCDFTFGGKVIETTKQPSLPACKAWTLAEAAKRGWVPAPAK